MGDQVTYNDGQAAVHTTHNVKQMVHQDRQGGLLDRSYYRGIPGLLKLLEVVLSILAFIMIVAELRYCIMATENFFKFATMAAFASSLVLWALNLLKVPQRLLRCACLNWSLVELVYYVVALFVYFFADLFMSLHACVPLHDAAVAFGWMAFVPFSVDLVFALRRFLKQRGATREAAQSSTTQATAEAKY